MSRQISLTDRVSALEERVASLHDNFTGLYELLEDYAGENGRKMNKLYNSMLYLENEFIVILKEFLDLSHISYKPEPVTEVRNNCHITRIPAISSEQEMKKLSQEQAQVMAPKRKCHVCGKPTNNYWCPDCRVARNRKYGIARGTVMAKQARKAIMTTACGKCPFCGSENVSEMWLCRELCGKMRFFVFCGDCGARGPERENREEARKCWNIRLTGLLKAVNE